ncbi:carbohydrate ABC transporter permease [Georgenia sp. SUBG003]|uniref:carbohydrate ABC transporter permease n=1 Tax=Georgenia sp. SUBG003 TaxID=1497974 RepID=UPI003AB5FE49
MAGYVFAKYRFRGRDAIFWGVVATMFLPPIVTLVPLYHVVSSLGLSDSYLGVMLPWLVNAFGIFLMRQFIADVPDELIDAARIDGASELRILVQVVAPAAAGDDHSPGLHGRLLLEQLPVAAVDPAVRGEVPRGAHPLASALLHDGRGVPERRDGRGRSSPACRRWWSSSWRSGCSSRASRARGVK